jgi:hypothetical protein
MVKMVAFEGDNNLELREKMLNLNLLHVLDHLVFEFEKWELTDRANII